jgi:hypothetical protein
MSVTPARERLWSQVGSLMFAVGACVLALCWVSRTGLLAAELARIVRRSELILIMISLGAIAAGCGLLWVSNHPRTRWRAKQPGSRFHSLVVYTRANCGLCDETLELLSQYREYLPPVVEVDIDGDPLIRARFDTCVPVVELDGKVRFRGHVNEVLLQRLIDGTPPNPTKARRIRET